METVLYIYIPKVGMCLLQLHLVLHANFLNSNQQSSHGLQGVLHPNPQYILSPLWYVPSGLPVSVYFTLKISAFCCHGNQLHILFCCHLGWNWCAAQCLLSRWKDNSLGQQPTLCLWTLRSKATCSIIAILCYWTLERVSLITRLKYVYKYVQSRHWQ